MNGPRALTLTDDGLRAIGYEPVVWLPVYHLPWRDDRRDLPREGPR